MFFFNLYKPRTYGYRPIYFDNKKELIKEREKRMGVEVKNAESAFKSAIKRGSFRDASSITKLRIHQVQQSNIRLIIILFTILLILYCFLK